MSTRRTGGLALAVVAGVVAVCRCRAFVSGGLAYGRPVGVARRAGFAFDLVKSEDHTGLVVEEKGDGIRVSTRGSFMHGNYNTVLGDKALPDKGRHYWEVKFVRKPSDAWEYVGIAEETSDVNVPLTRNKKGQGFFWGGTWSSSMAYHWMPMRKNFHEEQLRTGLARARLKNELGYFPDKDLVEQITAQVGTMWQVPGTHIGIDMNFPPFKTGTVVGVDVDMDQGHVSFWADGKFLGPLTDTEGKPVNVKGKKLVPALSVYGRTTGMHKEFTLVEVRSGLEPPPLPTS